jgi:hypothetical protein
MLIDDFATGPHGAALVTGEDRDTQSGTGILGGFRNTWLGFISSPFSTPVQLDVGSTGLIIASGPGATHRLELMYGKRDWTVETPLNLNLTPFRALRLRFSSNDLPLAFNIYLVTQTPAGPASFHWGTHIAIPSGDVDIPLADLRRLGAMADLSNIDFIWLIFFQALFGSNDYVIKSFEAV